MTDTNSDIILHNYPQSPVAEKVRVALGLKGLTWHSVEIPRLPPKPMLTKLTGGYRRTPVMQIGADIYCDSACIINELENRYPKPSFYPTSDPGTLWSFERWADGPLFDLAVKIVLGSGLEDLPPEFAEDRGQLYMGPDWVEKLKTANANLSKLAAQLRTQLTMLNQQLQDGRSFLTGEQPAAIDAQIYCIIWFIRGRWEQGPAFLSEFTALESWESKIKQIGHGIMKSMTAEDALTKAANNQPLAKESPNDPKDPQGLQTGNHAIISPAFNSGEQPVEGEIVFLNAERISLKRNDPDLGDLHIHFPRFGYEVKTV